MKKVLIIKNIDREGPGLIASWFDNHAIDYLIVEAAEDLLYSDFLKAYDGLIVLGGPASANDKTFVIQQELEFIKKWLATKKPYLGVCLGMQLMIKASGGKVFANKVREIGFYHEDDLRKPYRIQLENIDENPLKEVFESDFAVFQLHGETVSHPYIPSLAKTDYCNYQVCMAGERQLGVQFHFELSEGMLRNWIINDDFLFSADKEQYLIWYKERKDLFEQKCFKLMRFLFGNT